MSTKTPTTLPEIDSFLKERKASATTIDGHDNAVLGLETHKGYRIIYSVEVIINNLIKQDGMTHEEAIEFFEFNIRGGCQNSDGQPLFVA